MMKGKPMFIMEPHKKTESHSIKKLYSRLFSLYSPPCEKMYFVLTADLT